DAKTLKAEVVEAAGKTLLPGLIDVHVHLSAPGGVFPSASDYDITRTIPRELAAYLYSGVTAVKSVGDPLNALLTNRSAINSGERLGAELFLCGPMFTTAGGHGTEYFKNLPAAIRDAAEAQTVRLPKTPEEARAMVDALKKKDVDGIKAILEAGAAGMLFNRVSVPILDAIGAEARADHLPMVVHTGDSRDVADALDAGASGIEHGSFRDPISDELFARMKAGNITYDPTLVVAEAFQDLRQGSIEPLQRPLVLQVGPASLIDATKKYVLEHQKENGAHPAISSLEQGIQNLQRAYRDGVTLVTGTDSGNFLVVHGPALHRELQLWVQAGIPPAVALQAATYNGAKLLREDTRIGLIAKGRDADLVLVDGNPLQDIKQTEAIQIVLFRGEMVDRSGLFNQQ
ncbi:MAG TPA: amidohydrolase family protein, partial [Bryobacteraceae bacterium]|nr:amidohydrolase family protein [Bryobacteraceae bacterium]